MATSPAKRKPVRPRTDTAVAPENLTTRVTAAIRQSIVDAEFKLGEAIATMESAHKADDTLATHAPTPTTTKPSSRTAPTAT